MTTVDLNTVEMVEFTGKEDSSQHCRATFPLIGAHGSKELATVLIELAPGDSLGRHTDSAEELLVVLEGDLTAEVGGEFSSVSKGGIALVPKMAPHNLTNVGNTTARILGVFGGANNIVATFEQEWLPTNSNVVDTALLN
ncbi:MAG: cupin domain-containing protein [Imperialibacter sp.]|uniref:cupin domain-containing protein n=1 Tax=Imperialibacter sp. TaxID=2038411 RepID=UPI0032ECA887